MPAVYKLFIIGVQGLLKVLVKLGWKAKLSCQAKRQPPGKYCSFFLIRC